MSMDARSRIANAAQILRGMPQLMDVVHDQIDQLLKEHPELPDDALTRDYLIVLIWEKQMQSIEKKEAA